MAIATLGDELQRARGALLGQSSTEGEEGHTLPRGAEAAYTIGCGLVLASGERERLGHAARGESLHPRRLTPLRGNSA